MSKEMEQELLTRMCSIVLGKERADALSATLLEHFGMLSTLIESMPLQENASIAPEAIRSLLAFVPHIDRIRTEERMGEHPTLDSLPVLKPYVSALYAGVQYEQLCLLCLDKNFRLIECCRINQGSLKEVAFYPRRLLQELLTRRAKAIIVCHNHPSSWSYFSEADVSATRELLQLCTQNRIALLDHLLIARDRISSMRRLAYIPEKLWRGVGEIVPPLAQWCAADAL